MEETRPVLGIKANGGCLVLSAKESISLASGRPGPHSFLRNPIHTSHV